MGVENFDEWLQPHLGADDPVIRAASRAIAWFRKLRASIPESYKWKYRTVEALSKTAESIDEEFESYSLYWEDMCGNLEAYAISSMWRGDELINSSIRALNERDLVAGAIQARSLLELSATFLWNANYVSASVRNFPFETTSRVVSSDLEELVVKAIWGSRLVEKDDFLYPKSVLTTIDKMQKAPDSGGLRKRYEVLCEIAHPNALGYARYWSHIESIDKFGAELRIIERSPVGAASEPIIESTLWAISWGAGNMGEAFRLVSEAIGRLKEHTWGRGKGH